MQVREPGTRLQQVDKRYVFVCQNVDCRVRKGDQIFETLQKELPTTDTLEVRPYMCFGACHDGPNAIVYPDKAWFAPVRPDNVQQVVDYVKNGAPMPPEMDTIDQGLKDMIYQLLDAGLY